MKGRNLKDEVPSIQVVSKEIYRHMDEYKKHVIDLDRYKQECIR